MSARRCVGLRRVQHIVASRQFSVRNAREHAFLRFSVSLAQRAENAKRKSLSAVCIFKSECVVIELMREGDVATQGHAQIDLMRARDTNERWQTTR